MAIPRRVGAAAGILAASLLAYSAVGAIWGMLRPAYTGTLVEGGQVSIAATTGSVAFVSFGSFIVATGLLAVIISLSTYVTSPSTRGPGMLWWLTAVAALSAMGPERTFETRVAQTTAAELFLVGGGDPLLASARVKLSKRF